MSTKPKPRKCGTCAHSSPAGRLFGRTEIWCNHPEWIESDRRRAEIEGDPWIDRRAWFDTCAKWQAKPQPQPPTA